jgi:hypothetical protein
VGEGQQNEKDVRKGVSKVYAFETPFLFIFMQQYCIYWDRPVTTNVTDLNNGKFWWDEEPVNCTL